MYDGRKFEKDDFEVALDRHLKREETILKQIRFPIPSISAQAHIVAKIESRLSICDSIEKTVDTALQQAEAMRQSILKQAFEGHL